MTNALNLSAILDDVGPQFAARTLEFDQTATFVADNIAVLKSRNLLSALVPETYGGAGLRHSEMCSFLRALAHHCPATALTLSMHQHIVATAAANDRAGRPGRALLEKVAGAQLLLVTTGGGDWPDSNGAARRAAGGYLVSAIKPFASGSPIGDVLVTSAACVDAADEGQVIHFSVPLQSKGIRFRDDWDTFGMRATGSQTVELTDVFIPDGAVTLRRPRAGFPAIYGVVLTVAMPLIMSVYVGIAEAAAAIARERALTRASDSITASLIGEMETLLTVASLAHNDMVRLNNELDFEPSVDLANLILMRKSICSTHAVKTVEKAMEAAGGGGYFRKTGLEKLLRDAYAGLYHPLQEKRQHLFSGRLALGADPLGEPAQVLRKTAA